MSITAGSIVTVQSAWDPSKKEKDGQKPLHTLAGMKALQAQLLGDVLEVL